MSASTMCESNFDVAPSGIPGAGQGLFTRQAIAKGTRVLEYKGERRPLTDHSNHEFCFQWDRQTCIDGQCPSQSGKARWINDARRSAFRNNLRWVISRLYKTIWLVTIRPVAAGGELFVSYSPSYWRNRS